MMVNKSKIGIERARERGDFDRCIHEITSSTLCSLFQLLDLKDSTTREHSSRLAACAVITARLSRLSDEETRQIEIAAVLHDVGKIGIPDDILKKPSRLTIEEQTIMRKHPEYGWAVMRNIPGCEQASLLILHHHEMWDGGGYPAGLKGKDIPLGARIVAVADAFDAMTTNRCYRKGMPAKKAVATLERFAGTQFDAEVVEIFRSFVFSELFF
jgi:HD-GYP domain-containing protein (c-di-GMP phosphodiesterase class II)